MERQNLLRDLADSGMEVLADSGMEVTEPIDIFVTYLDNILGVGIEYCHTVVAELIELNHLILHPNNHIELNF